MSTRSSGPACERSWTATYGRWSTNPRRRAVPPRRCSRRWAAPPLLGLAIAEEYGGGAGDALAIVVLAEELTRASGGIAVTALVSGYMSTPHIARFGTDEQRARYLPDLIAGETIASIAVTEPATGSDVGGITTRATAVKRMGSWVGVPSQRHQDVHHQRRDRRRPRGRRPHRAERHSGITTFIVDGRYPGLSVGQPLRKMGWHASNTREVILSDCVVAATRCSAPEPWLSPDHVGVPAGAADARRDGARSRRRVPAGRDDLRPRPRGVRCHR